MFVVYAIIIFAILILIHEIGHLLSAKAVGIHVEEFALGMGPRVFKFERGGTIYSLRPVPIGGFCRMEGEDEDSEHPNAFNKKPAPARAFVLLSGSLANALFTVIVLWLLIFFAGKDHSISEFFMSFIKGIKGTGNIAVMMYEAIGKLFTGRMGLDNLMGPVGITQTVSETAKLGFDYLIYFAAIISLNLGIVNLLPLPALDGGRLLFLIIRLFTGKAISDSLEAKIHFVGITLLIGLMVYITIIDITRIASP